MAEMPHKIVGAKLLDGMTEEGLLAAGAAVVDRLRLSLTGSQWGRRGELTLSSVPCRVRSLQILIEDGSEMQDVWRLLDRVASHLEELQILAFFTFYRSYAGKQGSALVQEELLRLRNALHRCVRLRKLKLGHSVCAMLASTGTQQDHQVALQQQQESLPHQQESLQLQRALLLRDDALRQRHDALRQRQDALQQRLDAIHQLRQQQQALQQQQEALQQQQGAVQQKHEQELQQRQQQRMEALQLQEEALYQQQQQALHEQQQGMHEQQQALHDQQQALHQLQQTLQQQEQALQQLQQDMQQQLPEGLRELLVDSSFDEGRVSAFLAPLVRAHAATLERVDVGKLSNALDMPPLLAALSHCRALRCLKLPLLPGLERLQRCSLERLTLCSHKGSGAASKEQAQTGARLLLEAPQVRRALVSLVLYLSVDLVWDLPEMDQLQELTLFGQVDAALPGRLRRCGTLRRLVLGLAEAVPLHLLEEVLATLPHLRELSFVSELDPRQLQQLRAKFSDTKLVTRGKFDWSRDD